MTTESVTATGRESRRVARTERATPTWLFFVLVFGVSWAVWIPLAIVGWSGSLVPVASGAITPSLFGVLLTRAGASRAERRDFWRRVTDVRLISARWHLVIFLTFPAIMALTFATEHLLGGTPPPLDGAREMLVHPGRLAVFIGTMIVGGPLLEELGWRGFALDRLLKRYGRLGASILLGFAHAAWHIPLFFIASTSQGVIGFATPLFWVFMARVVATTLFYTWVYTQTRRSILSAILVHFVSNFTYTIVAQLGGALPLRTELVWLAAFTPFAAGIALFWRSQVSGRRKSLSRASFTAERLQRSERRYTG